MLADATQKAPPPFRPFDLKKLEKELITNMKHCKKLLSLLGVAALCTSAAFAGNGAPSGAHYNLNIIGVSNPKTADMSNSNGHVIFVALGGRDNTVRTKIILTEGDFAVTDKNG